MHNIVVEGFETEVLNGAGQALNDATLHCVLLESNGSGQHFRYGGCGIRCGLLTNGFEGYVYRPSCASCSTGARIMTVEPFGKSSHGRSFAH